MGLYTILVFGLILAVNILGLVSITTLLIREQREKPEKVCALSI